MGTLIYLFDFRWARNLIAIPLGIALTRVPKVANFVMGLLGIIQTVPSFAILAFFIPLLGVGKVPAIVALFSMQSYPS